MTDNGFNLFSTDGTEPIMPSKKDTDGNQGEQGILSEDALKSHEIQKVIQGDSVNTIMVPVEKTLIQPNYLLDIGGVKEPLDYINDTVGSLLDPDGDVAIYTTTVSGGIVRLGFGLADKLDMILLSCINSLYDGECKLYRNVEIGKKPVELKARSASTIRLKL